MSIGYLHFLLVSYTRPMDALIPPIEENIPLPASAAEALPDLSPAEELQVRANVIKLMADMTGQELELSDESRDEAEELARQMTENPRYRPTFSKYPNETLAYLAGLVAQMNTAIVDDLADLKLYVVNKLIQEVETAKDAKSRITALSKLGEIDGVDAFKKRTEMTVKVMPIEEVEKELLATLENIENRYIDIEAREIIDDEQENEPEEE
jgi:hypothetical protein